MKWKVTTGFVRHLCPDLIGKRFKPQGNLRSLLPFDIDDIKKYNAFLLSDDGKVARAMNRLDNSSSAQAVKKDGVTYIMFSIGNNEQWSHYFCHKVEVSSKFTLRSYGKTK